jgi:hypothetical protein
MYEKLVSMIMKLHERTRDGNVNWEQTVDDGVFQASFPNYSVQASRRPSRESPRDFDFVLRIFNDHGSLVEEVADTDLGQDLESPYQIMREIYDGARSKAMGLDDAINKIMSELKKDDIPF